MALVMLPLITSQQNLIKLKLNPSSNGILFPSQSHITSIISFLEKIAINIALFSSEIVLTFIPSKGTSMDPCSRNTFWKCSFTSFITTGSSHHPRHLQTLEAINPCPSINKVTKESCVCISPGAILFLTFGNK